VDPLFGTLNDAASLISEAHELGLRVIVDIVPNHTSDQHEWFRKGLRDRYVFRPGRGSDGELAPNDWESVFGGPAWTRVSDGSWYLHLFDPHQPDLNWESPEVHAEFLDILRFWLDLGVDGFRVDVAHGMVKAPGLPDVGYTDQLELLGAEALPYFDQDGVHDIYRTWREVLDEYPGDRIGVAEAWAPNAERTALYVRPDGHRRDAGGERRATDVGAVEPRRAPARHALRRRRDRPAQGAGGGDADAGAARFRVRLPGRGAGPARGARSARGGAAGPEVGAVGPHGPRT
jgi:hypothetical protein